MLQLPLLGSGAAGLMKGSGSDSGLGQTGSSGALEGLLQGAESAIAGFSGEMQAMLMQLSPQMLQRLDELLAGGMTLPQAASSLLTEAGYEGDGDLFANFLQDHLPELEQKFTGVAKLDPAAQELPVARMAENLLARVGNFADMTQSLAAPATSLAMAPNGQLAAASNISPQLTANLLDMGVPQRVGGMGWDSAIADRVAWMVQGEQQFAKLKLNPPNLGPLEVRVSINQEQTSVAFLAQHAAVREALEAALPRLREMFDQQSLQLVRTDISDPGAEHGDRAEDPSGRASHSSGPGGEGFDEDTGGAAVSQPFVNAADSLIDLFA